MIKMIKFKIDKGIEMPRDHRLSIHPFRDMLIGDSFLVRDGNDKRRARSNVSGSSRYFARKNPGYRFTLRTTEEGIRVWRIPVEETP